MKPRIAIPVPTTTDLAYNQRSWPMYAAAIQQSGGDPVEVPLTLTPTERTALLATTHGVLLTGSPADVNPDLFGAELDPATNPADPAREATDFALLDDAIHHGKPALGICYGVQSMNTWRGGTLVQDLTPLPVNHSAGPTVAIAHTALIAKDSLLGTLVDPAECIVPSAEGIIADQFYRLPINTSHHQAVAQPGDALRIVARCPDDAVIEAIELDPTLADKMFHVEHHETGDPETFHVEHSRFLLGIQWHPERSYDISPTSRNLFDRLVSESARLIPTA
ncbi:gamma-glutamyl-gamma-aminobutyrate hydrolase family protein [Granulicella sp. 5B5]|uniref:gamma-glutamyl-gamma-aminobutyrate hydrolase family protein n=1 Tax=Granulicella sp. 5B5 TaxID=1617967 RepID=UPI0015F50160|nr:gamma-glutamyl-gamma-aminobutyrate hydrolase family protein [Granulicella sp. 5B5]QMV18770.1 gamma-glutamyl-gamma-aminobutyrate hydrolase family protein [Granulicella sp. 5B5]